MSLFYSVFGLPTRFGVHLGVLPTPINTMLGLNLENHFDQFKKCTRHTVSTLWKRTC